MSWKQSLKKGTQILFLSMDWRAVTPSTRTKTGISSQIFLVTPQLHPQQHRQGDCCPCSAPCAPCPAPRQEFMARLSSTSGSSCSPSFLLLPPPTPRQGARLRTRWLLGCAGRGQPGLACEQPPLPCLLNAHLVCSLLFLCMRTVTSSFSYLSIIFIFVDLILLLSLVGVDSNMPFT